MPTIYVWTDVEHLKGQEILVHNDVGASIVAEIAARRRIAKAQITPLGFAGPTSGPVWVDTIHNHYFAIDECEDAGA